MNGLTLVPGPRRKGQCECLRKSLQGSCDDAIRGEAAAAMVPVYGDVVDGQLRDIPGVWEHGNDGSACG